MARPAKLRQVAQLPSMGFLRPVGIPANVLQRVRLLVEEAEAIRLKDLEGLEQEACAERMHISRPTFRRVLESGRRKLADALINGKTIQIEGGNFGLPQTRFKCNNDGHEWDVPFETLANGIPLSCPVCASRNIQPMPLPPFGFGGRGRGFRGGKW
jgi:predicted DNA-binding protein (UPF0251 family)